MTVSDTAVRRALAAVAMFCAEPSDRALEGWRGGSWLSEERFLLSQFAKSGDGETTATTGEAA